MKGEEDYYYINELLANYNIFNIASDIESFKRWVNDYHPSVNNKSLFEGYKYFIIISLRCIIEPLVQKDAFGLQSDAVSDRADGIRILLDDLPNSCEKIIVIKNLWNLTEDVRKSKTWNQLSDALQELTGLTTILKKIYDASVSIKIKISKEKSLELITQFYLLSYYNDTKKGMPAGSYHLYLIPPIKDPDYLKKAYLGYTYLLEYVWFRLLGREKYENSCIKYLSTPETYFKDINEKGLTKRQFARRRWHTFDKFFEAINNSIVHGGIPERLKVSWIDKSIFNPFLSKGNLPEPAYLSDDSNHSLLKRLDYYLLWEDFDFTDPIGTFDFNGKILFIQLLYGNIQLRKNNISNENISIRLFKHKSEYANGYDYSFAIFIEGFRGVHGDSGWFIVYDCANNYSGSGSRDLELILDCITNNKEYITVNEYTIDKNIFYRYLKEKSVRQSVDLNFIMTKRQMKRRNCIGKM